MKFAEIAKHFNPAWFAAVMGTAVIPLVLSFLDFPLKEFLGMFFFLAALIMFLLALAPLSEDEEVDLPFGRKNTWRVNLAFSQSMYSGGRIGAQVDIAAAARQSAELGLGSARAQLLFDVTQAFYDAALSERLVEIAEATLAQADATVAQVQASFEAGAQPEFELLRARVTRDNQQPAVIRQRANRDIAMLRLKQLLDLPADYNPVLVAPLEGEVATPPVFAERVAAIEKQAADAPDAAASIALMRS